MKLFQKQIPNYTPHPPPPAILRLPWVTQLTHTRATRRQLGQQGTQKKPVDSIQNVSTKTY
jgi:hypothetical protein